MRTEEWQSLATVFRAMAEAVAERKVEAFRKELNADVSLRRAQERYEASQRRYAELTAEYAALAEQSERHLRAAELRYEAVQRRCEAVQRCYAELVEVLDRIPGETPPARRWQE